nr:hypothetical protein [Streptomyces sp. SID5914]
MEFPVGWAIRHSVDRTFRIARVDRTGDFEGNDVLAGTDPVRQGLGACIVPESLDRFPDLRALRFARHVLVMHPGGQTSAA